MTETNAERLESIQNVIRISKVSLRSGDGYPDSHVGDFAHVSIDDYQWLIEQAERAQELDTLFKSHAPEGRNYTNEQYVELLQENRQFYEALEFYADEENCLHKIDFTIREFEHLSKVVKDGGSKARQAIGKEEVK